MHARLTVLWILFRKDNRALRKNLCCTSQKPLVSKLVPKLFVWDFYLLRPSGSLDWLPKSAKQTSKLIPVQKKG